MSAIKLLVILLFFYLCTNCEKGKDAESKVSLLTNDSIKIWHLVKIEDNDYRTIIPFPCIIDDEYKFNKNGLLLVNNRSTTYLAQQTIFLPPTFCKDTIEIIDTFFWHIKKDSLAITNKKTALYAKIIELTRDTLVIMRIYNDTIIQKEYYSDKN